MNDGPIFLDGFSTLPLAPEARAKMLEVWDQPGNAGSANAAGERAATYVADGRQAIANLIGAAPAEIIFTSGATEANNLALFGVTSALAERKSNRKRIVVSSIEHKAVLEPAKTLARNGYELVIAPVDSGGRLDLEAFSGLVDERVLLASVMMVNNETGVVQPVAEAAAITHASGGLFHSDAAQASGKINIDVAAFDIDYLSLSAHKCYGPMGIGALYVAAGCPMPLPILHGGGQQSSVRPGTEPVALIAGFGAAATLGMTALDAYQERSRAFIEKLLNNLKERGLEFERITQQHPIVSGSAAIAIADVDAEMLCLKVARYVSLSTGSACTAGQLKTSHVLEALGYSLEKAKTVVRILCNRYTDFTQVEEAAAQIVKAAHTSKLATGEVRQ